MLYRLKSRMMIHPTFLLLGGGNDVSYGFLIYVKILKPINCHKTVIYTLHSAIKL